MYNTDIPSLSYENRVFLKLSRQNCILLVQFIERQMLAMKFISLRIMKYY